MSKPDFQPLFLKALLFIAVCVLLLIDSACSNIFYQPSRKLFFDPSKFGLVYEEVNFQSGDGTKLHGWFFSVRAGVKEQGTIIQFHGNAENISTHFLSLVWITEHGYNLFIFDYRGYGKSEGEPSQKMLNADALSALKYGLMKKKQQKKINLDAKLIVYGQSLGGTVLLRALNELEEKSSIDAVVIESSFYSYQEIAREILASSFITWLFQPLAYVLVSDQFAPKYVIENISPIPILVIHGDNDAIVPFHHGKKIYDLAGEPKWFWRIKGGGHINAMFAHNKLYRKNLVRFLEKL